MLAHASGDKLFYASPENLKEFPSPESLKSMRTKKYRKRRKNRKEENLWMMKHLILLYSTGMGMLYTNGHIINFVRERLIYHILQNIGDEDDNIEIEELYFMESLKVD